MNNNQTQNTNIDPSVASQTKENNQPTNNTPLSNPLIKDNSPLDRGQTDNTINTNNPGN